jgi:DNA repair exonuclease SbcCD ATPase subunit
MFQIKRVELTNFRSFAGDHSYELPTKAGLYNLTGQNLVNPRLGANGTGKSTFLEAIFWCLYGKTS